MNSSEWGRIMWSRPNNNDDAWIWPRPLTRQSGEIKQTKRLLLTMLFTAVRKSEIFSWYQEKNLERDRKSDFHNKTSACAALMYQHDLLFFKDVSRFLLLWRLSFLRDKKTMALISCGHNFQAEQKKFGCFCAFVGRKKSQRLFLNRSDAQRWIRLSVGPESVLQTRRVWRRLVTLDVPKTAKFNYWHRGYRTVFQKYIRYIFFYT